MAQTLYGIKAGIIQTGKANLQGSKPLTQIQKRDLEFLNSSTSVQTC